MNSKFLYIILFGAGLSACSFFNPILLSSQSMAMNASKDKDTSMTNIISPYRDSLSNAMNKVLGTNELDLIKGRPCSPLNNWVADALLIEFGPDIVGPKMVLLNVGGIRSSLNKGPITVRDMFTLMPFDNKVVLLKMPKNSLPTIAKHVFDQGGEPIANALLKKGELIVPEMENNDFFWVITSDYLANGGDQMNFFKEAVSRKETGVLLRDVFIKTVENNGTIKVDHGCRIILE